MNPEPNIRPDPAAAPLDDAHAGEPRLWLSALADGDAQAVAPACALWRGDADARRSWHAYHLIGDVLRSDQLAQAPARDAAFLERLRARLAHEPVLLAPAAPARAHRWLVPMAAAAGFVAVAGVLVVARLGGPDGQSGWPSIAAASRPGVTLVSSDADAAPPAVTGGVLIRDARLDEYLRAHQAARGGMAVAAPGGTLRRVEAVVPVGAER